MTSINWKTISGIHFMGSQTAQPGAHYRKGHVCPNVRTNTHIHLLTHSQPARSKQEDKRLSKQGHFLCSIRQRFSASCSALHWWSNSIRLQEAESEILIAAKRHRESKISIAHFVAGGVWVSSGGGGGGVSQQTKISLSQPEVAKNISGIS